MRVISVFVKPESVEAFKAATLLNHQGSIKEPGVLRFDVLQDSASSARFLLYEVYRDEAAAASHKETPHYRSWKQTVEGMMERPRESGAYAVVAPLDPAVWRPIK